MRLALAGLVACCACSGSAPPPATQAHGGPGVSGTPLFCAYGGVGIVPDPMPPDFDFQFASVVIGIDNDGPPITGIGLAQVTLVGAAGAPLASMRRVDHFVSLPSVEPTGPTMGSFAVYLNPEGVPFDGTLPHGHTILRARVSIDAAPAEFPDHCRIEISGTGAPLGVDVHLDGVWPTS